MVYVVYVAWSSIPEWNPSGMMTIQQHGQFTPRFDRVICTPSCMCAQQHGRASHTEYGNFIKIFPGLLRVRSTQTLKSLLTACIPPIVVHPWHLKLWSSEKFDPQIQCFVIIFRMKIIIEE
jgi:hypothetical protein